LRDRFVLIDLNLHTALRSEFGDDHGIGYLAEDLRVCLTSQTVVESMQVGSSNNILEVNRLKEMRAVSQMRK
jgi:hypothetical protein